MANVANWNDMSSSDDQQEQEVSSPVKSQQDSGNSQNFGQTQAQNSHEVHQKLQKDNPQQNTKPQSQTQVQHTQSSKEQPTAKRTFLSDEELLNEYSNKRVDDPTKIKVVNCRYQQLRDMVTSLPNAVAREVKQGIFILNFQNQQGVLEFIQEKISKKWRFYLQPFMVFKKDQGKQQKRYDRDQKEGNYGRQKEGYNKDRQGKQRRNDNKYGNREDTNEEPKRERNYKKQSNYENKQGRHNRERQDRNRGEDKKKYERQDRQPRRENNRQQKQQNKKKSYVQRQSFQVDDMKSLVTIKKQFFQIEKVIEELQNKQIFKKFAKIYIKTNPQWLSKVSKLCFILAKDKKFCLTSPNPEKKDNLVQIVLSDKSPFSNSQKFYQQYHPTEEVPKQKAPQNRQKNQRGDNKQERRDTRKQKQRVQKKQEPVVLSRKLGAHFDLYFADLNKCNISQIVQGFDQNEFVRRLKQQSQVIFAKHWNAWKIQAIEQRIEGLLKLVHRLTKSTIYDVQLKPGLRSERALLTAQIRPRPEKDRRPKVDFSDVNGYLSAN